MKVTSDPEVIRRVVYERIGAAEERNAVSQSAELAPIGALADIAGISERTIQRLCEKPRSTTVWTLDALATACGVNVEKFIAKTTFQDKPF